MNKRLFGSNFSQTLENPLKTLEPNYTILYPQIPSTPIYKRIDHMGNYTDSFDTYLNRITICPLCRNTLEEPVTDPCGHTFCAECIIKARAFGNFCPVSGLNYETTKEFSLNLVLNSFMHSTLPCENEFLGCHWYGKRRDMSRHMKEDCQYTYCECPNPQCCRTFTKESLQKHIAECPYNPLACRSCGWSGILFQKEYHSTVCGEREVVCELQCGKVMKRKEAKEHYEVCTKNAVQSLFGGEMNMDQIKLPDNVLDTTFLKNNQDLGLEMLGQGVEGKRRKREFDEFIENFDKTCKKVLKDNLIPTGFFTVPSEEKKVLFDIPKPQKRGKEQKNIEKEKAFMIYLEDMKNEDIKRNKFSKKKDNEKDLMSLLEENNGSDDDLMNLLAGKNDRLS